MTELTEQEEQANPYNQRKSWHDVEEKRFLSADEPYFEEPVAQTEDSEEEATPQRDTQKAKPYKRPDYKKRYDDLKKHYDSKLNEFKQREVELQNQARPEYVAPKTPEELERFKKMQIYYCSCKQWS